MTSSGNERDKKTLSCVIPVFNEQECLPELIHRIVLLKVQLAARYDLTLILVDDGSRDATPHLLESYESQYPWITKLTFARNFGHQAALSAGLNEAKGDFIAILDADLQDPPELIPQMLESLVGNSVHMVYGRRISRSGESWFKLATAKLFYRLVKSISGVDIPLDTGDFRVIDQAALQVIRSFSEREKFFRGIFAWTGLSSLPFDYEREPRFAGSTKYGLKRMIELGLGALVSFSLSPFRAIQLLGASILSTGLITIPLVIWLSLANQEAMIPAIVIAITVPTGLIISSIGIVGGYVYRIQEEVRGRPTYVIERPQQTPGGLSDQQ